ncbi:MAG: M20/M25/M40 family metallo-hydrolase [Albidovulum sp.]|nr:M20/M25/M40 family metallo-hydrolase [Albidovulum sp.]
MSSDTRLQAEFQELLDEKQSLELLREAIKRESITGNESAFVRWLEEQMVSLSLDPRKAEFAPGRSNIWGLREGNGDGPRLLFTGHTDTVHVRGWRQRWAGTERENPFGAAVEGGEVWGRGAADLKGGICACISALRLLDAAGIQLAGDIEFAFVGDEESGEPGTGVSAGMRKFTEDVLDGEIAKPDFAIYVEPTRMSVFTAQIGFFIADVRIKGRTAYFGFPEKGVDAVKALYNALGEIWNHSAEIGRRGRHELLGESFALVTEVSGGGYIAVPGEASCTVIRKLRPGESIDAAVSEFEAIVLNAFEGCEVAVEISFPAGRDHPKGGSPVEIDSNISPVAMLRSSLAIAKSGTGAIEGAPFWSEASFLINRLNCPAVYCAPGDIANCHTLEERISIAEYHACTIAFALFMTAYCGVAGNSRKPSQ